MEWIPIEAPKKPKLNEKVIVCLKGEVYNAEYVVIADKPCFRIGSFYSGDVSAWCEK